MSLCLDCQEASDKWLDYRPVRSVRIASVSASVRAVIEAQKARADDTYSLIRSQQALIASICATQHQPPQEGTS